MRLTRHRRVERASERAEREGFEPSDPLPGQLISSESDSAALAPLQMSTLSGSRVIFHISLDGWFQARLGRIAAACSYVCSRERLHQGPHLAGALAPPIPSLRKRA